MEGKEEIWQTLIAKRYVVIAIIGGHIGIMMNLGNAISYHFLLDGLTATSMEVVRILDLKKLADL